MKSLPVSKLTFPLSSRLISIATRLVPLPAKHCFRLNISWGRVESVTQIRHYSKMSSKPVLWVHGFEDEIPSNGWKFRDIITDFTVITASGTYFIF